MKLNLKEAISQGKAKSLNARTLKFEKKLIQPFMTSRFFISIFERHFKEEGFGIPAGLTKKDRGMLNHLIKQLSHIADTQEIADIAKNLVVRWNEDIAEQEFSTVENKKMVMPTRPNLRAFLYCKNDIISFLYEEKEKITQEEGKKVIMPK